MPPKEPSTAVARAKVQLPADIQAKLKAEVAGIQSRIGAPAGNRIKVTQKKTFRMPSGEESPGPITAVILDFVSLNRYYPGVYDPDDITPPACFALGTEVASMAPHATVPANTKEADTCSVCPQNQWGSAERGKGKACQNGRLLALLPTDGTAESPIMTLGVSPTGLRPLDSYIASIARSFGSPPVAVVTTIGFDPNLDYPSLRFGDAKPCDPELLALAYSRREEALQILMTPPDTSGLKVDVKPPAKAAGRRQARAA